MFKFLLVTNLFVIHLTFASTPDELLKSSGAGEVPNAEYPGRSVGSIPRLDRGSSLNTDSLLPSGILHLVQKELPNSRSSNLASDTSNNKRRKTENSSSLSTGTDLQSTKPSPPLNVDVFGLPNGNVDTHIFHSFQKSSSSLPVSQSMRKRNVAEQKDIDIDRIKKLSIENKDGRTEITHKELTRKLIKINNDLESQKLNENTNYDHLSENVHQKTALKKVDDHDVNADSLASDDINAKHQTMAGMSELSDEDGLLKELDDNRNEGEKIAGQLKSNEMTKSNEEKIEAEEKLLQVETFQRDLDNDLLKSNKVQVQDRETSDSYQPSTDELLEHYRKNDNNKRVNIDFLQSNEKALGNTEFTAKEQIQNNVGNDLSKVDDVGKYYKTADVDRVNGNEFDERSNQNIVNSDSLKSNKISKYDETRLETVEQESDPNTIQKNLNVDLIKIISEEVNHLAVNDINEKSSENIFDERANDDGVDLPVSVRKQVNDRTILGIRDKAIEDAEIENGQSNKNQREVEVSSPQLNELRKNNGKISKIAEPKLEIDSVIKDVDLLKLDEMADASETSNGESDKLLKSNVENGNQIDLKNNYSMRRTRNKEFRKQKNPNTDQIKYQTNNQDQTGSTNSRFPINEDPTGAQSSRETITLSESQNRFGSQNPVAQVPSLISNKETDESFRQSLDSNGNPLSVGNLLPPIGSLLGAQTGSQQTRNPILGQIFSRIPLGIPNLLGLRNVQRSLTELDSDDISDRLREGRINEIFMRRKNLVTVGNPLSSPELLMRLHPGSKLSQNPLSSVHVGSQYSEDIKNPLQQSITESRSQEDSTGFGCERLNSGQVLGRANLLSIGNPLPSVGLLLGLQTGSETSRDSSGNSETTRVGQNSDEGNLLSIGNLLPPASVQLGLQTGRNNQ